VWAQQTMYYIRYTKEPPGEYELTICARAMWPWDKLLVYPLFLVNTLLQLKCELLDIGGYMGYVRWKRNKRVVSECRLNS